MFLRRIPLRIAILSAAALLLSGCSASNSPVTKPRGKTGLPQLTVLVVDDEALGSNIKAEWRRRTGSDDELVIKPITRQQASTAKRLPGDLIVFPAGHLGELVEAGLISPISEERTLNNDAFALRDIYKPIRQQEMKWGETVYALPLGSPQFLLVYRADIFQSLNLRPPQTWGEFDALAARLSKLEELKDLAPSSEAPWRGAVVPLAAGYAGQVLLARAAPYAAHKEQVSPLWELASLRPLIKEPPYVRALTEMSTTHGGNADTSQKLPRLTPMEAYQEVALGRCAMAVTWPSAATLKGIKAEQLKPLSFAPLPGASEVYDFGRKKWEKHGDGKIVHVPLLAVSGRMVAVTSTSSEQEAAENMATWLSGAEASSRVGPASPDTTMFRISQEPEAGQWVGLLSDNGRRDYVAALRQTEEFSQRSQGVRLPGRDDYLKALDEAVISALEEKQSPETALAGAATRWEKTTSGRGLEAQRAALERSLGIRKDIP